MSQECIQTCKQLCAEQLEDLQIACDVYGNCQDFDFNRCVRGCVERRCKDSLCELVRRLRELAKKYYEDALKCVSPPRGLCDHAAAIWDFLVYAESQLCPKKS